MSHRKMIYILFPLLSILVIVIVFFISLMLTVAGFQPQEGVLPVTVNSPRQLSGEEAVSLLIWNLGYAGLGEESTFIADGGKSILPPSRQIVQKNVNGIASFLHENNSDFFLLQEAAGKSRLIYNLDLWHKLTEKLSQYNFAHSPTVKIPWFPIIGRLHTGNAVFSIFRPEKIFRHNLPLEENGVLGIFQQKYNFMSARFNLSGRDQQLIVINLHLAAFDKDGIIRKKQLKKLKDFMLSEYEKGNFVVVGGDWNHSLTETNFPSTTKEKYLFWIHDLPADFTPQDWQWAFDEAVPTVRTLERPYKAGENYTCIIDGFLLSPNLELLSIKGFDLQFKFSDHQPIKIEIKPKG